MGASNWTKCPNCGGDFREDYEFYGASTGTLKFYYGGICCAEGRGHGCGARLDLKGEKQIEKPAKEKP